MTSGPELPDPSQQPEGQSAPPPPPYGEPTPPPAGQQPPPPHGQQPPAGQPYAQPYAQPSGYPPPAGHYAPNRAAPYGVHPVTGVPYSDKTKLIAGLLQILLPFGIGRFYLGDTKTGVWQLVVSLLTCGVGGLWSFIDGIIILATDNVTDPQGRPLRMS